MIGATLSRWTLSYFAAALLAFIATQILMAAGFGFPSAALRSPSTLVLVHMVALGWLSLLICGALFQFVPVLVGRPLFNDFLPLPTLGCLLTGIGTLVIGFLQLGGRLPTDIQLLPIGGTLLGIGFSLVIWNLGRTLWAARPLALPARFVAVGLFCLTATVTFGIIFAFVLGRWASQPMLLEVTGLGLPLHIIGGLLGWLTFTAMGVSYRLMAMFMLAPELDRRISRFAFYLGAAGLAAAIVGGTVEIFVSGNTEIALLVAGSIGILALLLYGLDILYLYRARKRRKLELNSRMAGFAFVSLGAAVGLAAIFTALGNFDRHVGAIVFLLAFGWLSGLGLSKLYKIVAFLTWLECYGPILGKIATPRVQDLVVEPRAFKWFALYFTAVGLGEAALLIRMVPAFRVSAVLMIVGTIGIVRQLIRTRRLADVNESGRLPTGAQYPRLLFSLAPQS